MAVCRPVLQILTLFQTKHCNFPHPFSDLASKIHTRFHVIITNIRRPTKRPLKMHFEFIGILLFLFYSFGIETTNKFIHPVVSSKTQENHSRFSTKSLYPVSNRNGAKNHTLWHVCGGTYLCCLHKGVPRGTNCKNDQKCFRHLKKLEVFCSTMNDAG